MQNETPGDASVSPLQTPALARRKLILHDGLTFFILILITIALFAVTLLLFRSFTAHRTTLATRWSARGSAALAAGHPADAVTALRTALSYDPDERANQLLLAQALGLAGHTEESTNYFLNLWETTPGDGFINLELARLARQANDQDEAVRYYRAAIYGSWQGDAIHQRRAVRLELLHYLLAQHDLSTAHAELLIAASDAPANLESDIDIGKEFLATGDAASALAWYQKALEKDPRDPEALDAAGQLAVQLGDTAHGIEYLQRALEEPPRRRNEQTMLTPGQRTADQALIAQLQQDAAAEKRSKTRRGSR